MREITTIIIHESQTPIGRKTTVEDIDSWHQERGFKRQESYRTGLNPHLKAIGYHWVIYVDGSIHSGRQVAEVGAHCSGLNSKSVGICLVGDGVYNQAQWDSLAEIITALKLSYPSIKRIIGHNDTPTGIAQGKTCPGFAVKEYVANNLVPSREHVA